MPATRSYSPTVSEASRLPTSAARFDLRAIMVQAVALARQGAPGQWRRNMRAGLRFAWSAAKAARVKALPAPAPQPVTKLALDRPAAFRLLARIKAHPSNRGRDLLSIADRLPDLAAVLAFARDEFRKLPVPDRAAMLDGLVPVPVAATAALRARVPRARVFLRGSRRFSHGW